jgi:toxin ParE1/3/4
VLAVVAYLGDRNPRAAHDFLAAHRQALATLRAHPKAGRRYQPDHAALRGLRVMPIPGFSDYLIFSRYDGATVDVIRVIHGARDILAILAQER